MISASSSFGSGVVAWYAARLPKVLRGRGRLLGFLAACGMHAVGHACVALFAGGIAVAVARMWEMGDQRSTLSVGGRPLGDEAFSLAALGLAVLVVKAAAGMYASYVQALAAGEAGSELRLELLDALLAVHRLRRPRHDDQGVDPAGTSGRGPSSARTSARDVLALTERVREVEVGLKQGLLGGVRAVAQLVPLALVLVVLAPRLAAVAAAVLAVFGVAMGRLRAGYQRATQREARERERLLEAADESVRHADLWVSYGAQGKARARVGALGRALATGAARLEARAAAMSGANEVLGAAALLLAIAASRAGWLGALASGDRLLAFAVAFFLAYRPLRELADARLALARAQGALTELRAVVDAERVPSSTAEETRTWAPGALEIRGLRLRRGTGAPLSLRAEPGSVVAIAGPTGAGKTTLLRTLLGLEPAAAGDVLYAGELLGEAPAGPAARPFAWVPQEAPLLADTLEGNVQLGARDADPAEALEPLGAAHLVAELEDARLGAGGRPVSGGERQWISLARAIATQQPVLLLDEPTSGLDAQSQRRVLEAIARLRGRRTVLIVTHRPEPLGIADVVVRLEAA
jgi:ATP-binding cassette, subfamily B, bacterial